MKLRKELNSELKRVVIKLGSSGANSSQIRSICRGMAILRKEGIEVILVSSGAVSLGKDSIRNFNRHNINCAQAASAIGQPLLMQSYQRALNREGLDLAQVLVTHDDIKARPRYLNIRNTLLTLLSSQVIPILNENDSVSFDEIRMGDNDQLAASIAVMLEADLLVLLTESDGLFDKDPSQQGALAIKEVDYNQRLKVQTKSKSKLGSGGMETKLAAIQKLTSIGAMAIVASHGKNNCLLRALSKSVGTVFYGKESISNRQKKNWIFSNIKRKGKIYIDSGAKEALLHHGSLLPIGVTKVIGPFSRGDSVEIFYRSKLIGVGLCEYDDIEAKKIMKKRSHQIHKILGQSHSDVLVHRDNLFITKDEG